MKIAAPLTLICALFVSACVTTSKDQAGVQKMATPPSASTLYQCESGGKVSVTYPSTESATVQYMGASYNMQIAVSGSGSRYVGGDLEWWTKGTGVGATSMLFHHQADGTSGDPVESCEAY